LEKYRLNFKINEESDTSQMNNFSESIQRFLHYLKKAIGVMQMQKRQLKGMSNVRAKQE